jgi:hypothetical protein
MQHMRTEEILAMCIQTAGDFEATADTICA